MVTFARFSAVSDSTQEDVSKPDANPLNDIVIYLPAYVISVFNYLFRGIFGDYYIISIAFCLIFFKLSAIIYRLKRHAGRNISRDNGTGPKILRFFS